jgi:mannose-6-phosphate isomerase-like protein (cupin superfamily)
MPLPNAQDISTVDTCARTVKVAAGEDRFGAALRFSNWRFDCKVSAKDTGGAYCIFDTVRIAKGGPPMHVHYGQDEWFFVRQGNFAFRVGDQMFDLGPGDSLLGPRGVPHAFVSLCDDSALTIAFVPAGTIEKLFFEICNVSRHEFRHWKTGPPYPADTTSRSSDRRRVQRTCDFSAVVRCERIPPMSALGLGCVKTRRRPSAVE